MGLPRLMNHSTFETDIAAMLYRNMNRLVLMDR